MRHPTRSADRAWRWRSIRCRPQAESSQAGGIVAFEEQIELQLVGPLERLRQAEYGVMRPTLSAVDVPAGLRIAVDGRLGLTAAAEGVARLGELQRFAAGSCGDLAQEEVTERTLVGNPARSAPSATGRRAALPAARR